ncbi:hypothetical protein FC99_GL001817 [Levilactobacillus koreensis JCM 16448]|uniref:Beta-1,6-galactofuranosyltransferase n=1 Tax=Levilactobacillus koreensis TaxID=637971 RepID=A0AAC8UW52_9LACO|nr:hypothetical protein [Levilactobacillus koreensis]AKP65343.1 hypothetical protein ABN16_10235 [Levilactobacillus koreensis]KRK86070.1 hypothetical protein FC99_GL001817 [Levilactobacillus koreensis JCM 16448]
MEGYYLTIVHAAANHAGSKAQDDVCSILQQKGLKSVFLDGEQSKWEKRLFSRSNLKKKLSSIEPRSNILVQYPFYMGRYTDHEIIRQVTESFEKSILMIHDIRSLRNGLSENDIRHEIKMFNKFKFLIIHNDSMKKWLSDHGCIANMYSLNVFDYVVPQNYVNEEKGGSYKRVFFAGNLGKSEFIYDRSIGENFEVYGINLKKKNFKFNYRGQLSPDNLVRVLSKQKGFGLVWDGADVSRSSEYTRYNSPHKMSLYLCSGMPVIVWKNSALAEFVEREKIGFSIENIGEIKVKLDSISTKDYNVLQFNSEELGKKLRLGGSLGKVIDDIFQVEE